MLVVGARGMGRVKGLLLGSVSRGVLDGACCPVGVVRGDPVADTGSIVVGVDGSSTAKSCAAVGGRRGVVRQRPLIALHALARHLRRSRVSRTAHGRDGSLRRVLLREGDRAASTGPACARRVEPRLVQAFAGSALVAESAAASLLVVGVRGHRSPAGRVLGSVSDHVAQRAQCPVVVIPLEDESASSPRAAPCATPNG